MANWVKNIIVADEETIAKLHKYMKSKDTENEFDFNNLIPEPDINPDWHSWRCLNWGNKWNACDVEIEEERISFLTAWDGVEHLMELLSERTQTKFAYIFSDEGIVSNSELAYLDNGIIATKTDGGEDGMGALFYIYAWDKTPENWLDALTDCRMTGLF